ncbi:MAG: hypothetical protein WCO45_13100 [Pseudanabaena sp. ELA607]|jgi:hypothetical protein
MTEQQNHDQQDDERGHKQENTNHISKTKMVMGALGAAAVAYGAQKVYEHHQHKKEDEEPKKH